MAHKFMLSLNILRLLFLSIFKKLQIVKSNTDFGYSVMYWANETIDVPEFFKTTYIERVKGKWDPKKKYYQYDCFKDDWQIYHLHHVCTKGGYDGLVIGIDGQDNDWHHLSRKDNFIISPEEWNKRTELNTKFHPLRVQRLHKNDSVVAVKYLNGSTLYANCYQQPSESMNPAHWMMKLGTFYEIASCGIRNAAAYGDISNMFKQSNFFFAFFIKIFFFITKYYFT